jgi:hypothetical protein
MKKNTVNTQAVEQAAIVAQPLFVYAGPDYGRGIELNGSLLQPRTWTDEQVQEFISNNPDRETWFDKNEKNA